MAGRGRDFRSPSAETGSAFSSRIICCLSSLNLRSSSSSSCSSTLDPIRSDSWSFSTKGSSADANNNVWRSCSQRWPPSVLAELVVGKNYTQIRLQTHYQSRFCTHFLIEWENVSNTFDCYGRYASISPMSQQVKYSILAAERKMQKDSFLQNFKNKRLNVTFTVGIVGVFAAA